MAEGNLDLADPPTAQTPGINSAVTPPARMELAESGSAPSEVYPMALSKEEKNSPSAPSVWPAPRPALPE